MVLNSLGLLLADQGRLREARTYLEQSLELKRKIANRRAFNTTLHNLGIVASKMGRYSEASKLFNEVLVYAADVGDLEAQADAYSALGSVATHLGSYQIAREHLERAILTYREFDSSYGICLTMIVQAMLAAHVGDLSSALSLSQEVLALAQELNLEYEQATAITYAGYTLLSMDRIEEASERFQEAMDLWQKLGESKMLTGGIETRAALARTCLAGGKEKKHLSLSRR